MSGVCGFQLGCPGTAVCGGSGLGLHRVHVPAAPQKGRRGRDEAGRDGEVEGNVEPAGERRRDQGREEGVPGPVSDSASPNAWLLVSSAASAGPSVTGRK